MSDKQTHKFKVVDDELHCECGGLIRATIVQSYYGIPAYISNEDDGGYDFGSVVLNLDTWNARSSDSEIDAIYCEDCGRDSTPGHADFEIVVLDTN